MGGGVGVIVGEVAGSNASSVSAFRATELSTHPQSSSWCWRPAISGGGRIQVNTALPQVGNIAFPSQCCVATCADFSTVCLQSHRRRVNIAGGHGTMVGARQRAVER